MLTAAAYCIWLFSRVSVREFITYIPYVLSDPEHRGSSNILWQTCRFFGHLVILCRHTVMAHVLLAGVCVTRRIRHREGNERRLHVSALLLFVIQSVLFFADGRVVYVGQLIVPLCIYAVELQMIYRMDDRKLYLLWMISFGYAFLSSMASNTGVSAIVMGFLPAAVPAWYIMGHVKGMVFKNGVFYCVAIAFLTVLLLQRVLIVNRDAPLGECVKLVQTGCAKGIYTSEEHFKDYEALTRDLEDLDLGRTDRLYVCGTSAPFVYLCADAEIAAPSVFPIADNEYTENYYALNPDMIPTVVYELKDETGSWKDGGMGENNAPNAEREIPRVLAGYMERNGYREEALRAGRVWVRMY